MIRKLALVVSLIFFPSTAFGWDGIDSETGDAVEIGQGNLVRSGQDIEIYDYGAGEYRDVTVENINRYGSTVEVEVYDSSSGEYRTFEMEGD